MRLLETRFRKSRLSHIEVVEGADSDGQPSIDVRIVFRNGPAKDEMRYERHRLVDDLRTWLAMEGDDRFPYFSFLTEKDEKELSSQD